MGSDARETYIRQVIESKKTPLVTIAWQGEPTLMGLDFFRRASLVALLNSILIDEVSVREHLRAGMNSTE